MEDKLFSSCLNLRLRESGLLFLNTNFCGALKQGTEPVRTGCLLAGRGTPQREQARRTGRVLLSLTSSAADCVCSCFIHFLSTTLFAFSAMNNKINAQQKASTHTHLYAELCFRFVSVPDEFTVAFSVPITCCVNVKQLSSK